MVRSLIFTSLLCTSVVHAQEQAGIAHSNYAGTDAVTMNPARMSDQWSWLDVNIIGSDLFLWNDHVYMHGRDRTVIGEVRESVRTNSSDRFVFGESLQGGKRHVFTSQRLKGPAFVLGLGRTSIGAFVNARQYASLTGLGQDLAHFCFNGLNYAPQHGIRYKDDGLKLASAAWTEFGLSYARILRAQGFDLLSVGVSAKYLLGHFGAGLELDRFDYTVQDSMQATIHEASGRYGIATPAFNAGHGFGTDVGAVYTRTLDDADGYVPHVSWGGCDNIAYRYRIGLSLLDLGGLRFNNALAGTFEGATAHFNDYTSIDISDENSVDSLMSASLSSFERSNELRIGLPTAIALQYDQRIIDKFYIATDITQNLACFRSLRLRRTNMLAVVPRFETEHFEFAVPVVLHEYDLGKPTVGLMLRMNNVIIGSDNALPLFTRGNMYGADIYVRIKWTVFRSPFCRGKKKARHQSGDDNALPCSVPNE